MLRDRFEDDMLACLPVLKAFALSLSGNSIRAEDLVQETIAKALAARDNFALGSNMPAWLCTILRNQFGTEYRKRRREVEDVDDAYAKQLVTPANQIDSVHLAECLEALTQLSDDQREAIELVGMRGYSYEHAAKIADCATGTVKSRLNRAREALVGSTSYENGSRIIRGSTASRGIRRFYNEKPQTHPAAPPLPVRRYVRGSREWETISREILQKSHAPRAKRVPLAKRLVTHISLFDMRFVLERTILLPDGNTQRIYKAA